MIETITITDVDTDLLTEQATHLQAIVKNDWLMRSLSSDQRDALAGVAEMLDRWDYEK